MTSVAQRLRQKLLGLAIHGKLVPQNPKDEPAGELLARIRKARSAVGGRTQTSAAPLPIPEEEIPFDLPRGWVWCRLTDIAEIQLGKMLDAEKNKGKPFRCLANVSVRWGSFDVDNLKTTRFTDGEIEKFALKQGDLLMCEGGVPGRCAVWRECDSEIKYQKALHRIRPCEVLPDYLQMYFEAIYQRPFFTKRFTGSTIHHLPREVLMSVPVPLPPLAEQKRIVEKLNAMLNETTRVAEGTERLAQLRKKARAKILDLAIRGKLVKQEKSDEPASELLKRIAAEKAKLVAEKKIRKEKLLPPIADDDRPFELPSGWSWCRLRDVVSEGPRNGYSPAPVDYDTGVRKLILSATTRGVFDGSAYKFIDAKIPSDSYLWLRKGDLLIQRSNSLEYLGMSCIYDGPDRAFVYPDLMMKVRANDAVLLEYLDFALKSATTHKYYVDHATGTAGNMPKINGEVVSMTPIPLPPLAEQRRIVAKVKELLAACDAFGGEG